MKRITFLTLILALSASKATALQSFDAKTFVEDVGSVMLLDLAKKITELGQSYQPRGSYNQNNTASKTYFANGQSVCGQDNLVGAVASIGFKAIVDNNILNQSVLYRGCDQGIQPFTEHLQTRGGLLKPLNESDILQVNRQFTLQNSEDFRKHSILDQNFQEIISFTTSKNKTGGWSTQIRLMNTLVASISAGTNANGATYQVRKYAFQVNDNIGDFRINIDSSSTLHFGISNFQGSQVFRDLESGSEVSFAKMNASLSQLIKTGIAGGIFKPIVSGLLSYFPASAPTVITSQMKNEILYLQNLLLSNPTDPNNSQRVLDQLTIWKRAIDAGEIRDSRALK